MQLVWTKHLKSKDRREDFEKTVRNSTVALTRIRDIAIENIEVIDDQEMSEEGFDNPNWPVHEAYRLGQKKAHRYYRELMKGVVGDR